MPRQNSKETVFFCTECGYESKKWLGQCPACHSWNSFSEEPVVRSTGSKASSEKTKARLAKKPVRLSDIDANAETRMDTGFPEFSRVLGGGIVPGSLVLIAGDPGIGKSTLLLQTAVSSASGGRSVLYISGEESLAQIRLRADRIGHMDGDLRFLSETDLSEIESVIGKERPDICILDSVQTMYSTDIASAPGSVSQVRECAQRMMMLAKEENIAIFLVGHVTKEGTVAGPRVLEHIVDTVLYFESGDNGAFRILRSAKNRFGSTNEIGVFEMGHEGLSEVSDPSELMLSDRPEHASGTVVTCLLEGTRPILAEVQGLVCESAFGMPRRQASGIDYNRLSLLLAVIEKRGGLPLGRCDAYVNVAGGMKVSEPSADLAVIAAVFSSMRDIEIPDDTIVFGEVGLSGEVRSVRQAEERIKEARKLGFRRCILPRYCVSRCRDMAGDLELIGVRYIRELFGVLEGKRS